jgi:hypothetical protein
MLFFIYLSICLDELTLSSHFLKIKNDTTVQLKAELLMARKEVEAQFSELRRLQGSSSLGGDKLAVTEGELRRLKAASQAEASRLGSRVAELEAISGVQRTQLDAAADAQAAAVREIQRLLDRSEFEAR